MKFIEFGKNILELLNIELVGDYLFLYIFALLYMIRQKKKEIKRIAYGEVVVILIICNPILGYVINKCLADSYFRIFWILQIIIIIAYVLVCIEDKIFCYSRKTIYYFAVIVMVTFGGKYMFSIQNYTFPENIYKIPQEVIVLCDMISEKDCKIAAPTEVAIWVRQYTADIRMAYGRYHGDTELKRLMEAEQLDLKRIHGKAEKDQCDMIVFTKAKIEEDKKKMEEMGYKYYSETVNYEIYQIMDITRN